jgi:hypothetical protein
MKTKVNTVAGHGCFLCRASAARLLVFGANVRPSPGKRRDGQSPFGHLSCGSRRIALLRHLAHAATAGFPSFGGQCTTALLEPIQALGHTGLNIQGSQQIAGVVRQSRLCFLAPHARLTGRIWTPPQTQETDQLIGRDGSACSRISGILVGPV